MCQGPIVVDDVLPAIIPAVFVKTPLERRRVNHGVSLMPAPGLGDERVRERCIELVGGDIQIEPFEPQPYVALLRILLELTRYHIDGNAFVFFTQKPRQQQARQFTAARGEHGKQVERKAFWRVLPERL